MNLRQIALAAAAALLLSAGPARADDLHNVKKGEPVPACKLPSITGAVVDSEQFKGSVVVYVCLSAEQRRSELAATESQQVVKALGEEPVKLVHVTADVVQKAYFEKLRADQSITADLAFDADRAFYGKLGLIAFPTTVIVNKEGRLENAISLHGSNYKNTLDAYIRHALGKLSDKELDDRLSAKATDSGSPRSAASAHRALARLMREKGQFDEARAELRKGMDLDPANAELMLDMAELELAAGNLDAADAVLQKVLDAQPEHRRAKQVKGIILFRQGNMVEAKVVLEQALVLNPSPEVVHYYLGQIAEKQGDAAKAIEHYREALAKLLHEASSAPAKPATEAPAQGGSSSEKPAVGK